ncbi:MAG TPA: chemotaxis protein CheW [Chthonomonadales bacterium]|nr:chemotaxis protein CheW [Chthonomonadales bacterium]
MQTVSMETRSATSETQQYLAFQLGDETYGVPLLDVQEIRKYSATTRVPNAPPYVLGVINLRGSIIAMLDLRLRLGLPPIDGDDQTIVVVVNVGGRTFGLRADSVSDVISIAADTIQDPPRLTNGDEHRFIHGLSQVNDRAVILLELSAIIEADGAARFAA